MQLKKKATRVEQLQYDVHQIRIIMDQVVEQLELLVVQVSQYRKEIDDISDEYDSCADDD